LTRAAFAAVVAGAMVACGPAGATDLVSSQLAGAVWRIAEIDGKPLVTLPGSAEEPRAEPRFTFAWRSYGGNAGCNTLGGLYAQVGDRLYTMPGPQTAMGCFGPIGAQEAAANAIFLASPSVARTAKGIRLNGGGHSMALERIGAATIADPPTAWQGVALAGQSFVVHAVNGVPTAGKRLWSNNPPRLRFSPGAMTLTLDCPQPAKGVFLQGTEHLFGALLTPTCKTPGTRDAAMSKVLGSDPRIVSGPNGELLLAGRAGWAILWNERRDRPK